MNVVLVLSAICFGSFIFNLTFGQSHVLLLGIASLFFIPCWFSARLSSMIAFAPPAPLNNYLYIISQKKTVPVHQSFFTRSSLHQTTFMHGKRVAPYTFYSRTSLHIKFLTPERLARNALHQTAFNQKRFNHQTLLHHKPFTPETLQCKRQQQNAHTTQLLERIHCFSPSVRCNTLIQRSNVTKFRTCHRPFSYFCFPIVIILKSPQPGSF